jgi:Gas vesicle synthesis protein GvpL/GvpF
VIPGFYVYAIGRAGHPLPAGAEAIDGSGRVEMLAEGELAAFFTPVDLDDYSQEVIDARAKDVEWLGALGYRHQEVMAALMRGGTIIPLRAFTLFGSEAMLRARLRDERERFANILERVEGKQEWTLRIELQPERWSEALLRRVATLRDLVAQTESAAAGRAFLLRKKLDEQKKIASRQAEQELVGEVERAVLEHLACDTIAETREQRDGAFPQINVLLNRDEESRLEELAQELTDRYGADGVSFALTGPWPPYTFS